MKTIKDKLKEIELINIELDSNCKKIDEIHLINENKIKKISSIFKYIILEKHIFANTSWNINYNHKLYLEKTSHNDNEVMIKTLIQLMNQSCFDLSLTKEIVLSCDLDESVRLTFENINDAFAFINANSLSLNDVSIKNKLNKLKEELFILEQISNISNMKV